MLPEYPNMMFHNVTEPSLVHTIRTLSLFSVREVLHLQHEYPKLTAGMHDKYCCQTAHADSDCVNDVTSQSLRELRDFEGWRSAWIEETTINWKGERSHCLVVNNLCSPCTNWHHRGEEYTCGIHEDRADGGEPPAELSVVHHYFSIFLMIQRDTAPICANVPNALVDILAAGNKDVLLYRGHQQKTDRTDHSDLSVEISIYQDSAESAWNEQETYQ